MLKWMMPTNKSHRRKELLHIGNNRNIVHVHEISTAWLGRCYSVEDLIPRKLKVQSLLEITFNAEDAHCTTWRMSSFLSVILYKCMGLFWSTGLLMVFTQAKYKSETLPHLHLQKRSQENALHIQMEIVQQTLATIQLYNAMLDIWD